MDEKTGVHGLPAKWRKPKPGDECTLYTMGIRTGRRKCADELEAALRQSGEVLATAERLAKPAAIERCDHCGVDAGEYHAFDCAALDDQPATSGLVEALRTIAEMKPKHGDELIDAVAAARDALAAHDARGG